MANGDKSFTLENYLNYSNTLDQQPSTATVNPFQALEEQQKTQVDTGEGSPYDFFAQAAWGGVSGLSWGASELESVSNITGQEVKHWEEMNDWEKAGWVTGEGLSLFVPIIGPFSILGRAGSAVTRKFGNKFIREAAEKTIKESDTLTGAYNLTKAGGAKGLSETGETLAKELYEGLTSAKTARYLADARADDVVSSAAEPYLTAASFNLIKKVTRDAGQELGDDVAARMSKSFVDEIKSGRPVNDIAEWTARWMGGNDPGNISKYLGMVAQDFLYMGVHGLGVEKIDSIVEKRDTMYGDKLFQSGIMALGFPLIRGIKGGGNDSLLKGAQAYFSRFKKINYGELAKKDLKAAKGLLGSHVKGGNFNIINESGFDGKFWTVNGTEYYGAKIRRLLREDGGKWFDDRPRDVVELLNKMRTRASQEFVTKWKSNYLSDLWASKWRLGTGILFMNEGAFRTGAFENMSTQELSSHLFMSALMTKSRGAWGHADKRAYMHKNYGKINRVLDYLSVDKTKFEDTITALDMDTIVNQRGSLFAMSPAGDSVVRAVDSVLNDTTRDWKATKAIAKDSSRYGKVEELLGLYNAIKTVQDKNFRQISIDELTPEAVERIKDNLDLVTIDGKAVKDYFPEDIGIALTKEFVSEFKSDMLIHIWQPLAELGFPIAVSPDKKVINYALPVSRERASTNVEMPATQKIMGILESYAPELGLKEFRTGQKLETLENIAKQRGITLEALDAEIGKVIDRAERYIENKYENHNLHIDIQNNMFLDSLKTIENLKAKDTLYKAIMGVGTDNQDAISLHDSMVDAFDINGKFSKNIYDYVIKDKNKEYSKDNLREAPEDITNALIAVEPIFTLMQRLNKGSTETPVSKTINKSELLRVGELSRDLQNRIGSDWTSVESGGLVKNATSVYWRRLMSGGNVMGLAALDQMREFGLIGEEGFVKDGIVKLEFPSRDAVEQYYRNRQEPDTAHKVNEAIQKVKAVFHKSIVAETDSVPDLDSRRQRIPLERYIDIAEHISNRDVNQFVERATQTIEALNVPSKYHSKLQEIQSLADQVKDNLSISGRTSNEGHPFNASKIGEITFRMREIFDALSKENLITGDAKAKLNQLITRQENITNEYSKLRDLSNADRLNNLNQEYDQNFQSINQFIMRDLQGTNSTKQKFSNLVQTLSRAAAFIDPDLTPTQTKQLIEKLQVRLRDLSMKETKHQALEDLILELNDANKWRDVEPVLENIMKSMNQLNGGSKTSYDQESVSILTNRKNEGIERKTSITLQELILKHPGIADSTNPNKLSVDFVSDLNDAGVKSRLYRPIWEKYIYQHIRDKHPNDPSAARREIADFNRNEALVIVNSVHSSKDRLVLNMSNDKMSSEMKPTKFNLGIRTLDRHEINDGKGGYDFALIQGKATIGGRIESIDDARFINGNWTWIQRIIDNSIKYNKESTTDLLDKLRFADIKIESIDALQVRDNRLPPDTDLIYMRLSPKLHIVFPKTAENVERLMTDFDAIYHVKEREYRKDNNTIALETLRKGFSHLLSSGDSQFDSNSLRTKMMFVHTNRTLGPEFDKMMSNIDARFGVEYNMYKRGYIADGGTSSNFTKEALSLARFHPDPDVRSMASVILSRLDPVLSTANNPVYSNNLVVDVVNDESAFFNNRTAVVDKIEKSIDTNRIARQNITDTEIGIKEHFKSKINSDENPYKSIEETFFLDGNKFASRRFAKLLWALNGNPDEFNGSKTTIMDGRLLGKGFIVYNPEIAREMKGDIMAGVSVAKTLGNYSRNYNSNTGKFGKLTPFELTNPDRLTDGWQGELTRITRDNQIEIPLESLGVGWNADKRTGVNMTSMMADFQSDTHMKKAINLFKLNELIDGLEQSSVASHHSNGKLLEYLYRARNEEFASTSPTHSLAEILANKGATEASPLVRKQLDKLMQSEYFKLLTHRTSRHGEETILTADINNRLSLPTYINAKAPGLNQVNTFGTVYQYGGASVTRSMADVRLGQQGLRDITFIARDTKSGADFIFSYDPDTKQVRSYSTLQNAIKSRSSFWEQADLPIELKEKLVVDMNATKPEMKIGSSFTKDVEGIIKDVNDRLKKISNPTHADIYDLLHGNLIPMDRRNDNNPFSLKLRNNVMDMANKYKMTTGMSVNAIPKVLKDQPIMRIERIQNGDMNGLSAVNIFDLRVTLQRDYDGDHLYKYLKVPFSMMRDYSADMGDIVDYRMFEKKLFSDRNGKDFNMFGFDEATGRAGVEANDVGFSRIASHISMLKKNLATVIGVKGTINHLANSGLMYRGKPLIEQSILGKSGEGADFVSREPVLRAGELFQNVLDIWKGVHPISWDINHLRNYFLFKEYPTGMSVTQDKVMSSHRENSFFNNALNFGRGSNKDIEREIFNIMHNTIKKGKGMYTDVWDNSGKRQPTPKELRDAHSKMESLFKDPDSFFFFELSKKLGRLKSSGQIDQANKLEKEILSYFFPEVSPSSTAFPKLVETIGKGDWKTASKFMGEKVGTRRDTKQRKPIFSIDNDALGVKGSLQGHMLDRAIEKEIFFQKDFNISTDERGTIQMHLNNLENHIIGMRAFGGVSAEEMLTVSNYDMVFRGIKETQNLGVSNTLGIMREIAHSQLKREHSKLNTLQNESFPDANKIERTTENLLRAKQAVDVLDAKLTDLSASNKGKDLIRLKSGKRSTKSFAEGNVYRIKKSAIFKAEDGKIDFKKSPLEYVTFVKKGGRFDSEKGYDYYVDTKPVKYRDIASEEGLQQNAFMKATGVGLITAETLLANSKFSGNTEAYGKILNRTMEVRAEIGREYSATLKGIAKEKFNFSDQFHYNSVITDRIIDQYFKEMVIDYGINPEKVFRYLIQPTIQRNVFYKDGNGHSQPYYRMNNHLVQSVMSWMIKPPMKAGGFVSNAEKYGFVGDEMIGRFVVDMNSLRDGKYDAISDALDQTKGMRTNSYNIEFDKFRTTTKDVITRDWFYHPVLSRYMKEMFINTGTPFTRDNRQWIEMKSVVPKEKKYGCN